MGDGSSRRAVGRWARGWYYEPFAGGLPTRQQLDAIVSDRPAQILSYDGHTVVGEHPGAAARGHHEENAQPAATG